EARKTINTWVEKETKEKIKDLLQPGVLTSDTRMVLTNAIYFKGDWVSQFKKDRTKDGACRVTSDNAVMTPLMFQKGDFRYAETTALQLLEMPYVGKEVTMVVLLPKKVDGVGDLEKSLTADALAGWLGMLGKTEVNVTLPKFTMTSKFSLKQSLSALGMP